MRLPQLFLLLLLISADLSLFGQQSYPVDYFISPVNIPISLSGSFAELRANHFHSGIDIKTGGEEGLPVFASANGFISRIKVSSAGYGKAIYIDHPNGYTTVYAHLQKFNPKIEQWVKSEQYRLQKSEADFFPEKGLLAVEKGDTLAFSGNSGSSEGPHLHFEIRDTKTEKPIDPLLFGLPVNDYVRPVIESLRIFAEDSSATISGHRLPYRPDIAGWGPVYRLKKNDPIEIAGKFSLGLLVYDYQNDKVHKNGVSQFEVYLDSALVFQWKATSFAFSETRYINSFIDYAAYKTSGERTMRTSVDPNNRLSLYTTAVSKGIFYVQPDSVSSFKLVVKDSYLNESVIRFEIKGARPVSSVARPKPAHPVFSHEKDNVFEKDGFRLTVPGKCIYDDFEFSFSVSDKKSTTLSPVYAVHNPLTPLHDYAVIEVTVDPKYRIHGPKLLLARLQKGRKPVFAGGQYNNGSLKALVREFGEYALMADTTAPEIIPEEGGDRIPVSDSHMISFTIRDDLSGIRDYSATLNNQWIVLEYDAKSNRLTYVFDHLLLAGENSMKVMVEDQCGNTATYSTLLIN